MAALAGSSVPVSERERDGSKVFLGGLCRPRVTEELETYIFLGLT